MQGWDARRCVPLTLRRPHRHRHLVPAAALRQSCSGTLVASSAKSTLSDCIGSSDPYQYIACKPRSVLPGPRPAAQQCCRSRAASPALRAAAQAKLALVTPHAGHKLPSCISGVPSTGMRLFAAGLAAELGTARLPGRSPATAVPPLQRRWHQQRPGALAAPPFQPPAPNMASLRLPGSLRASGASPESRARDRQAQSRPASARLRVPCACL